MSFSLTPTTEMGKQNLQIYPGDGRTGGVLEPDRPA